jgi:quinol monooxygenase YgiN
MEPVIVIASYKPKPGQSESLRQVMRTHLPTLRQQGLVTDRVSIMMEAKDGTIIEVFEWRSQAAIDQAHTNPAVLEMWGKYAEVCDYVPVGTVAETADMFPAFRPFS